jgi:hypothetical protein
MRSPRADTFSFGHSACRQRCLADPARATYKGDPECRCRYKCPRPFVPPLGVQFRRGGEAGRRTGRTSCLHDLVPVTGASRVPRGARIRSAPDLDLSPSYATAQLTPRERHRAGWQVTPTAVYPVTVQVAACTREVYRGRASVSRGPSDYRRPQGRQAGVRGVCRGATTR